MSSLHPFEKIMVERLQRGEIPSSDLFGGWNSLLNAASEIGRGYLMPDFLRFAIGELRAGEATENNSIRDFIYSCLDVATSDFALTEAVDLLEHLETDLDDDRLFARFLSLASDAQIMPMARAAALDGAFRRAFSSRKFQLRLMAFLLGLQSDDQPVFLSRCAKIVGVAYSHWRERELVQQLRKLTEVIGVQDEAAFELGMALLTDGLETNDLAEAKKSFNAARHWFDTSLVAREHRPDAAAYSRCLEALDVFSVIGTGERLRELASEISDYAFQMDAWHVDKDDPSWLGTRHVEMTNWVLLAVTLSTLSTELHKASWWEPAAVIKNHLLSSYVASRSILKRSHSGGVDTIIRPRIESSLVAHQGQAFALKEWLRRNTEDDWIETATELSRRIDAFIEGELKPHPTEATTGSVVALLEQAQLPDSTKAEIQAAIVDSVSLQLEGISAAEYTLFEQCVQAVSDHPDFKDNPKGRTLFRVVLLLTLRFLSSRLEMTKGHAPSIEYLFEREDGTLPKESSLQNDYYQFMTSALAGTVDIEVSDVGSGRADVIFKYRGERLVVEVKRENIDSSFGALEKRYAAQTSDYQNVSVRLGILLVLDQSEIRKSGTPHILSLVQPSRLVREAEVDPRWIIIVKMPGRRLTPSELSK